MLMEDFKQWQKNSRVHHEDQETFEIFLEEYTFGKGFAELINDLAWQLYEMQVIIEGFLEDQDYA